MVINKRTLIVSLFLAGIFFATVADVIAQRSSRTRRARRAAVTAQNKVDLEKGAKDVAIQVKNITKFVYVLGGVARGIQDIDLDVKSGRADASVARKNEEFKASVRASVRGIRAGLLTLESDFRTKPALKKYLFTIQPILVQSLRSEDYAFAGRFNDSGKELLIVIETLTDTLVEMP